MDLPIQSAPREAPGTTLLIDIGGNKGGKPRHLEDLQHANTGDGRILLVPQPSLSDPNDPLKWSISKKWIVLTNGAFYAFMGAVTGPIMAAGMVPLSERYNTTLQRLSYANGATLICQGMATMLWMPFAIKYGRRPVYLLSNLLMGVACIWCGLASTRTYSLLLAGRAFLGIFEAPIESIVPSTVTDIFFLHERGEKVSFYGLSVLGGNEIGPMLSAFIIQRLGMNWAFFIVGIIIFAGEIPLFFSMPETKFTGPRPEITISEEFEDHKGTVVRVEGEKNPKDVVQGGQEGSIRKKTYVQSLKPWGSSDPSVSLWRAFARPLVLVAYPTVLWSCLIYGLSLSWNVIIGASLAQIYSPPPYNFNSQSQGLVFLSPFVGSLVGTYLCGPLADKIANYYTQRNDGIREPEMRLPTCIIAAVLTFLGALMTALGLHYKAHWAVSVIGLGVLSVGGQMGATLSMSYSLDCHKELSVELMVTVACLKSAIAWIWTWVINDFLAASGPLVVFLVIASVNVAVYLTTWILYVNGKSIRIWLHEKNLLKAAGVD